MSYSDPHHHFWRSTMTIIMTIFGCIVFVISFATAGFKPAFKRLLMFIATGLIIDLCIVALAVAVGYVTL